MRLLVSVAFFSACLAAGSAARAGSSRPPEARSDVTYVAPRPVLAMLIGDLVGVAHPVELVAGATFAAVGERWVSRATHEDSDPCAQW